MTNSMSRRAFALAAGGIVLLRGAAGRAAPPNGQIAISNFAFVPATLTVAAGSEIVWINHDEEPHTINIIDAAPPAKSPALDTGDRFAFTLRKPGRYKYFCSIHPHMVGTIIVT